MATEMVKVERQDDVAIITLILDNIMHDDNEKLMQGFDSLLLTGTKKIILDFRETTYISSLILASFVYIHKKAHDAGGDLVFCHVKSRVQEILAMTNLDKVFNIVATRQDALAYLMKK